MYEITDSRVFQYFKFKIPLKEICREHKVYEVLFCSTLYSVGRLKTGKLDMTGVKKRAPIHSNSTAPCDKLWPPLLCTPLRRSGAEKKISIRGR